MGGRGASSSKDGHYVWRDEEHTYGDEYHTVLSRRNIKFLKQNNESSIVAPLETRTKGRVYVTVRPDDKLKSITYYDTTGKRVKSIDLDHSHAALGEGEHTHHGYMHNENDGPKGAAHLTVKEKKMIELAKRLWENRDKG